MSVRQFSVSEVCALGALGETVLRGKKFHACTMWSKGMGLVTTVLWGGELGRVLP